MPDSKATRKTDKCRKRRAASERRRLAKVRHGGLTPCDYGWVCQACGQTVKSGVMHHPFYIMRGINITPLSVYLCRRCHSRVHSREEASVIRAYKINDRRLLKAFWSTVRGG